MCVELIVDGKRIEELKDLDAAIGGEAVLHEGYPHLKDRDSCLCPVDIEATAEKFGYEISYADPPDYFADATLTRSSAAHGGAK